MTAKPLPPHGSLSRYRWHGCRCRPCADRNNAYFRDRNKAIADGTWQPFVDAEPVRQHILGLLEAGLTKNRIAELAGLGSNWMVTTFIEGRGTSGRKRGATAETAAKILAVQASDDALAMIDPIGIRRRVQALAAIGWPQAQVSEHAGYNASNLKVLLHRPTIRRSTAAGFIRTYDALKRRKPEQHGATKQAIARARNRAAAHKWPPPKYWDRFPGAIDDPHFIPEYGWSKGQLIAEEARFLLSAGTSKDDVARRLGVSHGYLTQVLNLPVAQSSFEEAA